MIYEQISNASNLDPAAAEAIKPYEDLARGYIEANAALEDETPEEFSAYLDERSSAPERDLTAFDTKHLTTLNNIAEIAQEAAASNSPDFKPQPWQRGYLAAIEAETNKRDAIMEMDYTATMEGYSDKEKITSILHAMSRERHSQAAAATDPAEKARLNQESRELSRFVRLRDAEGAADYDGAANEYYQTCRVSGEDDRESRQLVADQIDHDTLFVKYMPEAAARFRADEQEQTTSRPDQAAEAAAKEEKPDQVDFLSPEQMAAEKAKIERLNVSGSRRSAQPEAGAETEHDQALRDKAARILREARTYGEWRELDDRRLGDDGLNAKIREERRRGLSDGPAAQEHRKIREVERNQYFHTRTPEDIPKMFALLGLTGDTMQQRAEEMAANLRKEQLQNAEPGRIVYCNIGFAKNEQTGELEPGMHMISNGLSENYIDET